MSEEKDKATKDVNIASMNDKQLEDYIASSGKVHFPNEEEPNHKAPAPPNPDDYIKDDNGFVIADFSLGFDRPHNNAYYISNSDQRNAVEKLGKKWFSFQSTLPPKTEESDGLFDKIMEKGTVREASKEEAEELKRFWEGNNRAIVNPLPFSSKEFEYIAAPGDLVEHRITKKPGIVTKLIFDSIPGEAKYMVTFNHSEESEYTKHEITKR